MDENRVVGEETKEEAGEAIERARTFVEGGAEAPVAAAGSFTTLLEVARAARRAGGEEPTGPRPPFLPGPDRPPGPGDELRREIEGAEATSSNIVGRYVLLSLLGQGGMGVVHRAWDRSLARVVAIKFLREEAGRASSLQRERFLREGRAAARLQHPGIVAIYDVGEERGRIHLTMEYVEGMTLASFFQESWSGRNGMGYEEYLRAAVSRLEEVAEAVGHAHGQGIVHRDLKPANILLDASGRARVTDFGLAKDLEVDASLTESGAIVGTPAYMSPEQVEGSSELGPPSDVFSIGVILYEALTGRMPFGGNHAQLLERILTLDPLRPRRVDRRVPTDLETISLVCLEKEPARRYPDAAALAADLGRCRRGEPVEARPVSLARRFARRVSRHRMAAAVAAFVVGSSALAGLFWLERREQELEVAVRARAEELVAQGEEARERGRTGEALERLGQAVREAPDHDRAWRLLGEILLEVGDAGGASRAFEQLTRLRPLDATGHVLLARALLLAGLHERATEAVEEALRLAPLDPEPLRVRAEIRSARGDLSGCVEDLRRAAAIEEADLDRRLAEIDADLEQGELRRGFRRLVSVAGSARRRPEWLGRRGLYLARLDPADFEAVRLEGRDAGPCPRVPGAPSAPALRLQAEDDLRDALAAGSDGERFRASLVELASARGGREAALEVWEEALRANPDDVEARRGRVALLLESVRWRDSGGDLERILALEPGDPMARYWRALFLLLDPELPASGPRLGPTYFHAESPLLFNPGIFPLSTEESARALADLDRAIEGDYEVERARYYRAAVLAARGERLRAEEEVEALLAARPEDAVARTARAHLHLARGDFPAAEAAARDALAIDPDCFAAWIVLGGILRSRGETQEGARALAEARERQRRHLLRSPGAIESLLEIESGGSREEPRYGITLEDLASGHARFRRDDLGPFVRALGEPDPSLRDRVRAILIAAGPGALPALGEAAAGTGAGARRAAELRDEIERVVHREEEGVAEDQVRALRSSCVRNDPEGAEEARSRLLAGGPGLVPVLSRLVRRAGGEPADPLLPLVPRLVLAEDSYRPYRDLLAAEDLDPRLGAALFEAAGPVLRLRAGELDPSVLARTADPDPRLRAAAVLALAPVPGSGARERAETGLRERSPFRGEYAAALVSLDAPGAADLLGEILRDEEDPAIRVALVRMLGDLGDPGAVLDQVAADPGDPARLEAIRALGRAQGSGADRLLAGLLEDPDRAVAAAAARALGGRGSEEALPALRRLLDQGLRDAGSEVDPDRDRGLAAAWALRAMGESDGRATARLLQEIPDQALPFEFPTARVFELGDPVLSQRAFEAWRTARGAHRIALLATLAPGARTEWVPELAARLDTAGAAERRILVEILGELGREEAVPALERRFDRAESGLDRVTVAWALARCGRLVIAQEARTWWAAPTGRLEAAELLARTGDPLALDHLGAVLAGRLAYRADARFDWPWLPPALSWRPDLRLQAAEALAGCGRREGLLALAGYLASGDLLARRRAWRALRRLTGLDPGGDPLVPASGRRAMAAGWERALRR